MEQSETQGLPEPVGFEFGEGGLGGSGAGDGDEEAPDFREFQGVSLDESPEPAPEKVAIVGLAAAFGGDEAGAERREARISQGTQNDKPAGFRLTGVFDARKIRAARHTGFARESHGRDASGTRGGVGPENQELCWLV